MTTLPSGRWPGPCCSWRGSRSWARQPTRGRPWTRLGGCGRVWSCLMFSCLTLTASRSPGGWPRSGTRRRSCWCRAATAPSTVGGWPRARPAGSLPRAICRVPRSPRWSAERCAGAWLPSRRLASLLWSRPPSSRSGLLMAATGFAWFAGSFASAALFLHRGPLVHLLIGYPRGRLRSRLEQVVVGAAYVDGVVYPLARQDLATIALSLAVVVTALVGYLGAGGPERRARAAALAAASAVALALGGVAVGRVVDVGADATGLWVYQAVLVLVAVGLFTDLLWGRWTQVAITGLVVDLGELDEAGTLRAKLARAIGDPSLVVAYRVPDVDGYVDEAGRPVALPAAGANRTVTHLRQGGQQIGALVHDAAVLDDPDLVSAVAAAAGVAVTNARLQAEVRARVSEVEASRRRIVQAGDAERRRLE